MRLIAFALAFALLSWAVAQAAGAPTTLTVKATADIYSAGLATADKERGGTLPPSVPVMPGAKVTILSTSGKIGCCGTLSTMWGPQGGNQFNGTTVTPARGISGIRHASKEMFVVGLFASGTASSGAGPRTLDVTLAASNASVSPALYQVFYIGAGKTATGDKLVIKAPAGATRLYLGFADASAFNGTPGAYVDNPGKVTIKLKVQ
ncbi:MAG TPA: hypothetical protein VN934_09330 [Candidatus Tumulicola sp.]|nr:hypothetical protein [Candidatus Tumulicola sp.]